MSYDYNFSKLLPTFLPLLSIMGCFVLDSVYVAKDGLYIPKIRNCRQVPTMYSSVLRTEPRALCTAHKHSVIELDPQSMTTTFLYCHIYISTLADLSLWVRSACIFLMSNGSEDLSKFLLLV